MKKQNLIGQTFGQLTVTEEAPSRYGLSYWVCECACGQRTTTSTNSLKKGSTTSCGCYRRAIGKQNQKIRFTKHGEHKTRLYGIYNGMRKRCYTSSSTAYKNYGAIGIKVSPAWGTYDAFKAWAVQNGYSDNLTLDRKDSALDYSPENCHWVTHQAQNRNRRKQSKPASSKYVGVSWNTKAQKWVAYVTVSKQTHIVGQFSDEVSAAKARDSFIKENNLKHFKLNF